MTQAIEAKTREDWLAARRERLTASDGAAALGLSPYKSPLALYTEKIGLAADLEENEAMSWGRALQGGIGARFAEVTGRQIIEAPQHTLFLHPGLPWLGATLDFFEKDKEKGDGVLETKASGKVWENEPPLHYQVQLQLQLAIVARPYGTLAAFQGLRRPPAWADLTLNEQFIKRALGKLEEFWWRVQTKNPPAVVADGSESTAAALKLLYPREQVETITLTPDALAWTNELRQLKAGRKELDEQIRARENSLKAMIGPAEIGVLPDGSAWSWKAQHRSAYTVAEQEVRVLRHVNGGR